MPWHRRGQQMTEPSAPAHRIDSVYLATLAGLAIIYFAAARFGLSLAFTTKQVTAVWPPTGIALVAFLVWGIRVWPGVFVAALAANAMTYEGLPTAFGIAAGNTCAGILGAVLLGRFAFEPG